jgi:hypothetical protein
LLALGGPVASASASGTATLSVSPATGTFDQLITITGVNFGSSEKVNIFADTTSSTPIYAAVTDSSGSFLLNRRLVAQPGGSHTWIAVGLTSGDTATTGFLAQSSTTLIPTSGLPGQTIAVKAHSLGAKEAVSIRWDTATGTILRWGRTNARGTMGNFFIVPAGATPGQHLVYTIGFHGLSAFAVFNVG